MQRPITDALGDRVAAEVALSEQGEDDGGGGGGHQVLVDVHIPFVAVGSQGDTWQLYVCG